MKTHFCFQRSFISIFFIAILLCENVNAKNYYFSSSTGNDAYTSAQAQNPATPWLTLNKLNSFFSSLLPGDSVLFNRGDVFYGTITTTKSGTSLLPIVLSAYGNGAQPIVSGFISITSWTNLGGNIWESTNVISSLSTLNMVTINGVEVGMGRTPNTGYYTYQSSSSTSITSSNLTGTPNYTGGEIVLRANNSIFDRSIISSQTSGTLNFATIPDAPTNGFGFFIQNSILTLDQQNEWYYNPTTNKIDIYSTTTPLNVLISSIDILVTMHSNYVTFNDITFQGANSYDFYNDWSGTYGQNNLIQNCKIFFSGINGIYTLSNNLTVNNCSINYSNNNAIFIRNTPTGTTITNNTIQNTGTFPGMGQSSGNSYNAILMLSSNVIIAKNIITNTGYDGISFIGDNITIQNNYIDTFCSILQDGGGIYTIMSSVTNVNRLIKGNIVLNGLGAISGTNSTTYIPAEGIYLDQNSANVEISYNTVANCANQGIFFHNAANNNTHNNTFYNNYRQIGTQSVGGVISNLINSNLFVSKKSTQFCDIFFLLQMISPL